MWGLGGRRIWGGESRSTWPSRSIRTPARDIPSLLAEVADHRSKIVLGIMVGGWPIGLTRGHPICWEGISGTLEISGWRVSFICIIHQRRHIWTCLCRSLSFKPFINSPTKTWGSNGFRGYASLASLRSALP